MSKQVLKLSLALLVIASAFSIYSCSKEDAATSSEDVQNFVEETVYNFQREGNCGKFGCYEFVFPVTIQFPDSTTADVNSYEEMKTTLKSWREANMDVTGRPSLAFPLDVISEDGEVINVASGAELAELQRECRKEFYKGKFGRHHKGRGHACFKLAFPVSITFPDGTTTEYADHMALRAALKEWKRDNRGSSDRPELAFPVNVELEDGTVVSIASKEDMKTLKETCNSDSGE